MGRNLPLVKQSTARSVSQKSGHTPPHHEVGSYHAVGMESASEENQLIGCAGIRLAERLAGTTVTPAVGLQRDLAPKTDTTLSCVRWGHHLLDSMNNYPEK